jgi:hypothetical protein
VKAVLGSFTWWLWILLVIAIIGILVLLASHWIWQKLSYYGFILGLVVILVSSYNFGSLLASHTEEFYVLNSECVSDLNASEPQVYIVPTFYREFAIVTPITTENMMTNGFYLHPAGATNCILKKETIGRVH